MNQKSCVAFYSKIDHSFPFLRNKISKSTVRYPCVTLPSARHLHTADDAMRSSRTRRKVRRLHHPSLERTLDKSASRFFSCFLWCTISFYFKKSSTNFAVTIVDHFATVVPSSMTSEGVS